MAKKKPAKKRRKKLSPIPDDFPAISAHLVVAEMKKAMDLYQKAFGFKMMGDPIKAGRIIVHAVMAHHGSVIMLGGPTPDGLHRPPLAQKIKGQSFGLYVYVKDVDAHHKKVKRFKGLTITAPMDTFWGDRLYDVTDRDGHCWTFASRKSEPTPEEMAAAMQAMMEG